MKIGILTFHNVLNYGAILQCYALQNIVKSLGHDTSVIDFKPDEIVAPYRLYAPLSRISSPLMKLKYFIHLSLISRAHCKRRFGFKNFLKKYIRLSSPKESFDCIIYGSDQIWNPKITHSIPEYWGGGALHTKKKVSYAASAGNLANLGFLSHDEISDHLQNFEHISVREENLKEYLHDHTDKKVRLSCDPVILNTKQDWVKLCNESESRYFDTLKDKYIFVYNLTAEDSVVKLVEEVKQATGLQVIEFRGAVCIDDRMYPERQASKSPLDLVNAIRNAAFVVTSSFHGLAFSLIFGRKFIIHSIHNTDRMKQLLKMANLEHRFTDRFRSDLLNDVDEEKIDEAFAFIRKESMQYLKDALK